MNTDRPGRLSDVELARLELERATLAIPMRDLRSLEPMLDMVPAPPGGCLAGVLSIGDTPCPVYCLTDALLLTDAAPASQRICALIDDGDTLFGLVCRAVSAIPAGGAAETPIPTCMEHAASPIEAFALHRGQVMWRTSGAALHRFFAATFDGRETATAAVAWDPL